MSAFFDDLETRDPSSRVSALAVELPEQIARAQALAGNAGRLDGIECAAITSIEDLVALPILRKSELVELQRTAPPFGQLTSRPPGEFDHVHQSPGPIYEPGMRGGDWWRFGRFMFAAGIGADDIVQNCFGYHLTPAGMMFESGAEAVGAAVLPAGTGQTEQQVQAAAALGTTAYAGTPDYLKVMLEKSDELNLELAIQKAVVSGGALFPALRDAYSARGIACLQCYATADLGLIAYESPAMEGMIVDEAILVEIVTPGTGDPVEEGDIGEVVVTSLNPDYPLIRFATGDMSAVMPGASPCGRTTMRIKGWLGRADQTTKVKGMFVRPEQVAALVARFDNVDRARVVVTRAGDMDAMELRVEGEGIDTGEVAVGARDVLKLAADVTVVQPGGLPRDGVVIEDKRDFGKG